MVGLRRRRRLTRQAFVQLQLSKWTVTVDLHLQILLQPPGLAAMPPRFVFCYLCGRQFTKASLPIHEPQVRCRATTRTAARMLLCSWQRHNCDRAPSPLTPPSSHRPYTPSMCSVWRNGTLRTTSCPQICAARCRRSRPGWQEVCAIPHLAHCHRRAAHPPLCSAAAPGKRLSIDEMNELAYQSAMQQLGTPGSRLQRHAAPFISP